MRIIGSHEPCDIPLVSIHCGPELPVAGIQCFSVGIPGSDRSAMTELCEDSNIYRSLVLWKDSRLCMHSPLMGCLHRAGRQDLAGMGSTAAVEKEQISAKTLGQVLVSEMCQVFKVHSA